MNEDNTDIKRFVAPSMSRALELVRDEMGPEAIILSSRKVSGGVEIVTSVERDLPTRGVSERRAFGQNFDTDLDRVMDSDNSWQSQAGIEQAASRYEARVERNGPEEAPKRLAGEDIAAEIERARERMLAAKREAAGVEDAHAAGQPQARVKQAAPAQPVAPAQPAQQPAAEQDEKLDSLRSELDDLRMLLEQQMWSRMSPDAVTPPVAPVAGVSGVNVLTEHLSRLGLSQTLVQELCASLPGGQRVSQSWKQALAMLARRIPIASHLDTAAGGIFAFIGPTGVGKTTTLAKLAARYAVANGPGKVAIVSMDTHRVGAIDQLKALGRILDAPVRAVSDAQSLMTTIASLRSFPLILVDTAGYRSGDPRLKAQLQQLDENPGIRRMLVLSSLSQLETMKASIHAYRPRAGLDGCVLSKLDEANSLGEAISAVVGHALGVAYVTDGQQIPGDLHDATGHKLIASAVALAKQRSVTASVAGDYE